MDEEREESRESFCKAIPHCYHMFITNLGLGGYIRNLENNVFERHNAAWNNLLGGGGGEGFAI